MQIVVCRHGQTEWNQRKLIQGQLNSELTPQGVAQAEALPGQIANIAPDVIFTSDLNRCLETTKIINSLHRCLVKPEPRLRERHFGELQGMGRDQRPEYWHAFRHRFEQDELAVPGAESSSQVQQRIIEFLDELRSAPYQTVLLVSHGEWIRTFLNYCAEQAPWINFSTLPANCELIELHWPKDEARPQLVTQNIKSATGPAC